LKNKIRIAILGGGPSGMFMFKRLVDSDHKNISIDIFEKKKQLGVGMPYSVDGANDEHITNVSGNEIPEIVTPIADWIKTVPPGVLERFHINPEKYNDYKVLPRLLFGQYLSAQFDLLQQKGRKLGILNYVHFDSQVTDIIDHPVKATVSVEVGGHELFEYDRVIICTGHKWPLEHEGIIPGYFDSPYPPSKLAFHVAHAVAIKGSSLTAIDGIRTLARYNGAFSTDKHGKLNYRLNKDSKGFKLMMHSRNGMLPAIRFHLKDPHLEKTGTLTKDQIKKYRAQNNGFLSLDYVFEHNFKLMFRDKEPAFYEQIKDMRMELFVDFVMDLRERVEPFDLFEAEYIEAARSIKKKESVYWKEVLAILSFAMNYPAKYLPAEDMQRLQKVLMPLISIVIAFVPQSSVEEMIALHNAGVLSIIEVGDDSHVEAVESGGAVYHYIDEDGEKQQSHFKTYVDCVGQPHLSYKQLPYPSLISNNTISPARLKFKDPDVGKKALKKDGKLVEKDGEDYYLKVPGITINDNFQIVDGKGLVNDRIYMMAVPYIGGYNPDYSGLDFSEEASGSIIKTLVN
jgi:hypothetical protein